MSTDSNDYPHSPVPETDSPEVSVPVDETVSALPPVEAPTAGFILQLFLIPMMIVSVIVGVWLAFTWMAHLGNDPQDLVAALRVPNESGWQKADILAEMLRNPSNDHLKKDVLLAENLAQVLRGQLAAGATDEKSVLMRVFVCRALGEFRVAEVLPALIEAVRTDRTTEDLLVRDAALQAIAVLARNLVAVQDPQVLQGNEQLLAALLDASRDYAEEGSGSEHAKIRSAAAYSLGVLGGQDARDRLGEMLRDAFPNARYNAAIGLCRHGDMRAVPVLLAMLDPQNREVVDGEESDSERLRKRSLVMMNAIRAAGRLAVRKPDSGLSELRDRLAQIRDSDLPQALQNAAREALTRFP
ncbi:MAG: HEAT repeat domain-containing protein [Planctomycetota bacterium]|nr:HEAT repeat domain-containing protein [Planctomycetota bacterium]